MDAIHVAQDLENEFKIPCVRGIQVNRNAQGKKVPIGENNSLTPEQIANDRGNPNGNTLSIYIKHLPGIAVIDFDTKVMVSTTPIAWATPNLLPRQTDDGSWTQTAGGEPCCALLQRCH